MRRTRAPAACARTGRCAPPGPRSAAYAPACRQSGATAHARRPAYHVDGRHCGGRGHRHGLGIHGRLHGRRLHGHRLRHRLHGRRLHSLRRLRHGLRHRLRGLHGRAGLRLHGLHGLHGLRRDNTGARRHADHACTERLRPCQPRRGPRVMRAHLRRVHAALGAQAQGRLAAGLRLGKHDGQPRVHHLARTLRELRAKREREREESEPTGSRGATGRTALVCSGWSSGTACTWNLSRALEGSTTSCGCNITAQENKT
jgi:hypothetical protein